MINYNHSFGSDMKCFPTQVEELIHFGSHIRRLTTQQPTNKSACLL